MYRRFAAHLLLVLGCAALLLACGEASITPATPRPELQPTPTAGEESLSDIVRREAGLPIATGTPQQRFTPVPAATAQPVGEFAQLMTYDHPQQVFSIDIPADWYILDMDNNRAVGASLEDPQGRLALLVLVLDGSQVPAEVTLEQQLRDFADSIFRASNVSRGYTLDEPVQVRADHLEATLAYRDVTQEGEPEPSRGKVVIRRQDDFLSFLAVVAHADNYDELAPFIETILDSYSLNTAAAGAAVPAGVAPTPTPLPETLDSLPVFPLAEPLPAGDPRARSIEQSLAEQFLFEGAQSDYRLYTVGSQVTFGQIRSFYMGELLEWQDQTESFAESLQMQEGDLHVWQRNQQLFLISTVFDPLEDETVLVTLLITLGEQ